MSKKVTVIVDDKTIYVDGFPIECIFEPHKPFLKAVQWDGVKGHLEFEMPDGEYTNAPCNYVEDVKNYISIWETQKIINETPEEIAQDNVVAIFKKAVTDWMDDKVREREYDDVVSCVTYENDENPKFAAEAAAVKRWRSKVYTKCYELLNAYTRGEYAEGDIPDVETFLNMMPQLEW